MKPHATPPFARRLLFALGLLVACLASHAMAQDADITAGLDLFNKPLPTSKRVTWATVTAADLQSIESTILATSATTYYVNGTTVSGTAIVGGTAVNFPALANAAADTTSVIATLGALGGTKLLPSVAAEDLITYVFTGLTANGIPSTSSTFGAVTAAAMNYTALTTGAQGLSQAKADAAELVALENAVTADGSDYDNLVVAALSTSDPAPASEGVLVDKTYAKIPTALTPLGVALATSGELTNNGGPFMQNFFELDKLQADQENFVEGYTSVSATTASALETTATSIVSGAPAALAIASRTNIALGLFTSGTTSSAGANANTILADVTTGIISGYITNYGGTTTTATAADKLQATLASDLISALGVSDAEVIAQAGAVDLALNNQVSQDVAAYAQLVAKNSLVKLDASGVTEAGVAQGVANDYQLSAATDSADIGLKAYITQGVVAAYKTYAPQIVDAVALQILQESYTSAQFATALATYVQDISSDNAPSVVDTLAPGNALDGTMLAALAQYVASYGNAASTNSVIAAMAVAAVAGSQDIPAMNNNLGKDSAVVLLPVLSEFATSGSISTVQAIASAIAQTGTASSGQPTPDAVTAALITAAKTNGTLVQYIIQGAATNPIVVSQAAYGGTDGFVKTVAFDIEGSTADITDIANGLAGYTGFTPEQVATDLVDGAEKDYVTISDVLAGLYPTQSASIAGAISSGTSISALPTTAAADGIRYKVAADILGTAGVGATYAAAVSGSVGATIATNADRTVLAEDISKTYAAQGTPIADAIALTVPLSDTTLAVDLDSIAAGVIKEAPATLTTTATSVEQIALNEGTDPVITGTSFGNTVMGLTGGLPVVVQIAQLAAADQTLAEAGAVGTGVAQLAKVEASLTTAGSVAATVAAVATEFIIPGDTVNPTVDDNNYSYYTIAGYFGTAAAANAKLALDLGGAGGATGGTGSIAYDLALGLQESGTAGEAAFAPSSYARGAQNQAAAAIVYDLSTGLIAAGYTSTTAKYLQSLAAAVATVDPQVVADIYGYLAEAVKASSWSAANQALFLYGKATYTSASQATATASLVGVLEAASGGSYDPDITAADGELANFTVDATAYMTWDETPIVNF